MDNIALVQVPLDEVTIRLFFAVFVGSMLGFVYSVTFRHNTYTKSFRNTVILLTPILAGIILTIGSNIALSLGLVGSLSIIRFRAVVKDTVDMFYLFWSIGEGIAIGAGQFNIAIIIFLSIIICFFIIRIFFDTQFKFANNNYLIRFVYDKKNENKLFSILDDLFTNFTVKTSSTSKLTNESELNILFTSRKKNSEIIKIINSSPEINKIAKTVNIFSADYLNTQ